MENKEKEDSYSHILKYTGILGGVQGLSVLVGIVRNKFAALFLGPNGMGMVSLLNSTVNMMVSATSFGIPTSAVHEISENYHLSSKQLLESIKLIRSWVLLTAVLGVLVCVCLGPLFNNWTFTWGNHTLHYMLLAPTVGLTILVGGEMAVLKATRQLKALAYSSLYVVAASLMISAPVYYLWGQSGIVFVLNFQAFVQLVCVMRYSLRYYPYSISLSRSYLKSGAHVIRLGIAFVLSGVINSGAEFLVRTYLNNVGDLGEVGLFNACSTLVLVYGGLVFSAMESDYYPRLSCIKGKGSDLNACVNRQIEVNTLLISPFIIMLIFGLPILIPLLYDKSFMGILLMAQFAAVSMLFRAVYLPIEYLPLSKGQSFVFLGQETFAVVLLFVFEIVGFNLYGLTGMGIGIVLAYFVEAIAVCFFSRIYYSMAISKSAYLYMGIETLFCFLALTVVVSVDLNFYYWLAAFVFSAMNVCFSLYIIKTKTHLIDKIMARLKR